MAGVGLQRRKGFGLDLDLDLDRDSDLIEDLDRDLDLDLDSEGERFLFFLPLLLSLSSELALSDGDSWRGGGRRSSSSPQLEITTGVVGRSFASVGSVAMRLTTSSNPRMTRPKTTCFPLR